MRSRWLGILGMMACLGWGAAVLAGVEAQRVILVVGAGGEEGYAREFEQAARAWRVAAAAGGSSVAEVGVGHGTNQLAELRALLVAEPGAGGHPLWVVLVGHGTFDGAMGWFNLEGPDLSAAELAGLLKNVTRPTAVVLGFSASGSFVPALSRTNRVIVSATRNGGEHNYSRFANRLGVALGEKTGPDLDHDGQVSLLELFLHASSGVAEFYKAEGRLATEHALLDDNGDGAGTPPEWFRGVQPSKAASGGAVVDGIFAQQFVLVPQGAERALSASARIRRGELELEVRRLRGRREAMGEEAYFAALETLMLELGRIYDSPR